MIVWTTLLYCDVDGSGAMGTVHGSREGAKRAVAVAVKDSRFGEPMPDGLRWYDSNVGSNLIDGNGVTYGKVYHREVQA
jgi:hypothetical protein